ncbi:unnamed protein product [Dovyalis caffra]|uniref:Glucose-methanol-choline oxidoreductase N-terminal domain-containing protein n=1 Tax=Dovyalis caffra TaxID=77055 RepID=A0AAV1RN42_9ROSI|nr:unnamed protein product [Dovyalis caffra]
MAYAFSSRVYASLSAPIKLVIKLVQGNLQKPEATSPISKFKLTKLFSHLYICLSGSLASDTKAYLGRSSKNEIILSAGALGIPQLLTLSGFGPANHLQAHSISVVVDQPIVGQGMADDPTVMTSCQSRPYGITMEASKFQVGKVVDNDYKFLARLLCTDIENT